ncbi:hypothetical protein FRC07_007106, partial [Ceratobasidium sp. 392]
SLRRAVSESHPERRSKRTSALPMALTQVWDDDTQSENAVHNFDHRVKKYGLPANPRDSPMPVRPLRPTPDTRRVKLRQLHQDTVDVMRTTVGERDLIDKHYLALNGFYGGLDAHFAAYDEVAAAEYEKEKIATELKNKALDLAVSQASERRASLVEDQATISVSRKGSAADTLMLPEFRIGATPISPGQDMPSSPHAPFEWDNIEPFGQPSLSPLRPVSVEERLSTYRKMSQPELEIELARKPRPATIQNEAKTTPADDAASVKTSKSSCGPGGRKRMGVILDGRVVLSEMERCYGGGRI